MEKRSRRASFVVLTILLAVSTWTASALAQTGPQQSEERWEAPVNRSLLIGGGVLFFGAYVPSLIYAKSSSYNSDTYIKYPLVGPWLDLGARRCSTDPCDARHLSGGLLVADGVLQGLGLASMVAGLLISENTMRRWLTPHRVWVTPARVSPAAYGLGAAGAF